MRKNVLAVVLIAVALSAACASAGGGVKITAADLAAVIEAAKKRPAPVVPPVKADPPVVVPAPVDPPVVVPRVEDPPVDVPPAVVVPPVVLSNLNIVVTDSISGAGLNGAACIVNGDRRLADGSGFVNFAVPGPALVLCSAAGYASASLLELAPGDRRFPLVSNAPPAPVIQQAGAAVACGVSNNSGRISRECLEAVAARSKFYPACQVSGGVEVCQAYVFEVARALADHDPRWGVIKKTQGGENVEGYGVDVVAYLPAPLALEALTWRWMGADIIGGAGAPGARFQGGALNEAIPCSRWVAGMPWCNREGDLWAPVPARR